MNFIKPMLCSPLPKGLEAKSNTGWAVLNSPREWAAEEKFDGHRLIVRVGPPSDLLSPKSIVGWSRNEIQRILPKHIVEDLVKMPDIVLDGELIVPGGRSYGVKELLNEQHLIFVVFDVLEVSGYDATSRTYSYRRELLKTLFERVSCVHVRLAASHSLNTWEELFTLRDEVWKRDGEGLIIKKLNAQYTPGKRSKHCVKIKQLRTAVLEVIGFAMGNGKVIDRGPYATVILRDAEGHTTTVKTLNDDELKKLNDRGREAIHLHPDLGRMLCIEYQERTPDGSYRHPRWDRWEDE